MDNLYDMLYDAQGNPKGQQASLQKLVVKGDTLDILGNGGQSIQFKSLTAEESTNAVVENLKVNKTFKAVNTIPRFQSVPATAHLFDLAGSSIDYANDKITEEAQQF